MASVYNKHACGHTTVRSVDLRKKIDLTVHHPMYCPVCRTERNKK